MVEAPWKYTYTKTNSFLYSTNLRFFSSSLIFYVIKCRGYLKKIFIWKYVKVWDHGLISLNCLFLAIHPHLKTIQLIFIVFHPLGYMVGTCGEQFCEQVLLRGLLFCQKTQHFLKNQFSNGPYQTSSLPQNHFFCTPIKTRTIFRILWSRAFSMSTLKLVTLWKNGFYCRFKQYICVRAETQNKYFN